MPEKRINKRRIKRKGYSVGADITQNKRADVFYRNALDKQIKAFMDSLHTKIKADFGNSAAVVATVKFYETSMMAVLLDNSEKIINKWLGIATKTADKSIKESIYGELADSITINYSKEYDDALRMIVQRNVALIRNATTQTLTNVENIVFDSMTTGQGWLQTERDLLTQTHISRDRVKRIARDQTAKTNTALNYLSQKAAGIEYFEWRTANDERVSTGYGGHKQLNGKIYKWGDDKNYPIIDSYGHQGIPSQRPNCRCVALPVFVHEGWHLTQQSDGSYKIEKDNAAKVNNAHKDNIKEWITVKGNHIPIKEGQSKEVALKEFFTKKEKSKMLKTEDFLGPEYKGVKGQEAIDLLMKEKQGFVRDAFTRKDIGGIALVWGVAGKPKTKKGFGLAHIIRRRTETHQNLDRVLSEMQNVIDNGVLEYQPDGKFKLMYKDLSVIISPDFFGNKFQFIITSFEIVEKSSD